MRVEAELFIALRQGMAVSPVADASLDRWTDGLSGDSPSERLLLSQMAVRAALTAAGAGEVAALAGAALGGGKLLDDVSSDSVLAFVPLYPLLCADRIQLVSDYLDKAFEDARRRGSPIGFAYALTFRAHLELVTGEIRAAESDAAQAFEIFESFRQPFNLPGGADALLGALIEADRAHEGEELIRRLRLDGSVPDTVPGRVFLASRGRLRLEKGRVEEALADYLDLLGREREKGRSNLHLTPHVQWAAVSLYLAGRREEALDLAREGLRVARHWGPGRLLALNLTLAARTLGGEEGFELLSEAVAVAEQSPSRLALAYALAEKGAALRRSGRRLEAIDHLRTALDHAHRCGAAAVAKRARADLVLLGARPRRFALWGVDALTPAEWRVAELAARGLTNRQIAETLFLTMRTVEHHLTRSYQKLGIASRAELEKAMR